MLLGQCLVLLRDGSGLLLLPFLSMSLECGISLVMQGLLVACSFESGSAEK